MTNPDFQTNSNNRLSSSKKNVVCDSSSWTQHTTKEGRIFWYNTITSESTWTKPDELKTEIEKAIATLTSWKEYTAVQGRVYWFNKDTKQSVWTCPDEIIALTNEMSCEWKPFTEKSEARDHLKLKRVTLRSRFDDAFNTIKNDPSILTTGEKKQVFAEYQSKLQKIQREKERERKVEARKMFIDVLSKWAPLTQASLISSFQADNANQWWLTALPVSEQEDLFNDYIDENASNLINKQRLKRQEAREKNNPSINVDMNWYDAIEIILQEKSIIPEYPTDILTAWEQYVYAVDKKEKLEMENKIRRVARHRRDAFRKLIKDEISSGHVHARVSFSSFIEKHKDNPAYTNLVGVPLATPREIYEDEILSLVEAYEKQKAILKKILRNHNIDVKQDTTLEQLKAICKEVNPIDIEEISEINWDLFFQSLKKRALKKDSHKRSRNTYRDQDNEKKNDNCEDAHENQYFDYKTYDDPKLSHKHDTLYASEEKEDGALSDGDKESSPVEDCKRPKWNDSDNHVSKKIRISGSCEDRNYM